MVNANAALQRIQPKSQGHRNNPSHTIFGFNQAISIKVKIRNGQIKIKRIHGSWRKIKTTKQ